MGMDGGWVGWVPAVGPADTSGFKLMRVKGGRAWQVHAMQTAEHTAHGCMRACTSDRRAAGAAPARPGAALVSHNICGAYWSE